jgi:putative ABC transport system permease protein
MITTTFLMAITAIRRNAMRSFLTTLGVIIGVASVIAMVTLGRGATASVTNDISALGNNLLIVAPGADRRFGSSSSAQPFNQNDVSAKREEVHAVSLVAPERPSSQMMSDKLRPSPSPRSNQKEYRSGCINQRE